MDVAQSKMAAEGGSPMPNEQASLRLGEPNGLYKGFEHRFRLGPNRMQLSIGASSQALEEPRM